MTETLEDTDSSAAAEGTRAHDAMEDALKTWIALGDSSVNMTLCDDQEMFDHVSEMVAYVISRYETMPGDNKFMIVENRVNLHYMTARDDLWGKADVIIGSSLHLDCMDLKYGAGIFVDKDTSQNRIYLLGAMSKLMKESKGAIPWKSVRGTIMQPRYKDNEGNAVRWTDFDPDDLIAWKDDVLIPAAELTDNPGAPVAGKEQCMFCKAKSTCPAVAQRVTDLCSVFQPQGVTIEMDDVDGLQVDRLLDVHDAIPFIEGYLKAVSAKLRTMLEARDERLIGKLKLIRSRKTNKWDEEDQTLLLEDLSTGKGRIPKKLLIKEVIITAPQALKLKSLKPAQKAKMQAHVTKSEGSLSIVPDSDPRDNEFPPIVFEDQSKVASKLLSDEGYDFL